MTQRGRPASGLNAEEKKQLARERTRVWKKKYPQKVKANNARWLQENKERAKQSKKAWVKKNVKRVLEKGRVNQARYLREAREKVYMAYGNKCSCCGESNFFFLTIDHVNNDGKEHRGKFKSGKGYHLTSFFRQIIKDNFPGDLRLLCWNCNCGRQRNGGVCPHVMELL